MMKRLTALVLSLIMAIGCFAFTVSAEESENNNWAADKDAKYTTSYVSQWDETTITWREGNEDAGNKLLTDGKYSDADTLAANGGAEVAGTTVAMKGRHGTYTYIFDLGKTRDIQGLKLLNVRQDLGEGTSDRGLDVVTFGYSTDGKTFKDFAVTEEFLLTIDAAATAKNIIVDAASLAGGTVMAQYVKIAVKSTGYVASLDEIQIWDVIPELQVVTNATLDMLGIYGADFETQIFGNDATAKNGEFVNNIFDRAGAHKYVALVPDDSIYLNLRAFTSDYIPGLDAGLKAQNVKGGYYGVYGELDAPGRNMIYGDNSVVFIVDVSDTISKANIAKVKGAISKIVSSLYNAKYAKFTEQEFAVVVCNDDLYCSGWIAINGDEDLAKFEKALAPITGNGVEGVTDIEAAIDVADILADDANTDKVSYIVIGDGQFETDYVLENTKALQVEEFNPVHNAAGAEALKALVGKDNFAVLSDKAISKLLADYLKNGILESFWLDPTITVSVNGGESVEFTPNSHYGHTVADCTEIADMESVRTDVRSYLYGDFTAVADPNKADSFAASLYETAKSAGKNQLKFTATYKVAEKDYYDEDTDKYYDYFCVTVNVDTTVSVAVDGTITIVSEEYSYETTEGWLFEDKDNYLFEVRTYGKKASDRVGEADCDSVDECTHAEDEPHILLTDFQYDTVYEWCTIADYSRSMHVLLKDGKNEIVVTVSAPCYDSTTYTIDVYTVSNIVEGSDYTVDLGKGKYYVDDNGTDWTTEDDISYADVDNAQLTNGKLDEKPVVVQGKDYSVTFDLGVNNSGLCTFIMRNVADENRNIYDPHIDCCEHEKFAAIEEIVVSVSNDGKTWTPVNAKVVAEYIGHNLFDFTFVSDFVNGEFFSGRYVKVDFVGSANYIFTNEIEVWATTLVKGNVKPTIAAGDVNADGVVDCLDAAIILKADAELITLSAAQVAVADVNNDGVVDTLDASVILQLDAGLIEALPEADAE